MNATICDVCDARATFFTGGPGWREVKLIGVVTLANRTTHVCAECWNAMVHLRTEELAAGGA